MISYTGLRQLPRLDLAKEAPLPMPMTLHVEPTSICNFHCSFCPVSLPTYDEDIGHARHMNLDLYQNILANIAAMGKIRALKLYMVGEPFLNRHLSGMIALAYNAGIAERIEVTTNGSLVSGNVVDEIIVSGLDYLRFSIYVTHETQITRNVRNIVRKRDELHMTKPYICVKYIAKNEEQSRKFLKTYSGVGDEQIVESFGNWGGMTQIAPPSTKQVCPYLFYMLGIKANGDVVPCCMDWKGTMKLGNINNQSLREIWDGSRREEIVRAHLERDRRNLPACLACTLPSTTPDNLEGLTKMEYDRRKALNQTDDEDEI